jgi:hypothetical protein
MCNMKKRVLFGFLLLFLILNLSLILAEGNETKINKAYSCLEGKVEGECSSLTMEQQIFSLLAIGECEDEILDDSNYMSNTKLTAQAILALDRVNTDTDGAEEWLYSQNATPDNMDWLLQIESTEETTCTISYEGSSFPDIVVREDKTISNDAGACLTRYGGDYWLRISHSCSNYQFEISCDKSFSTNLLYKKTQGTGSDIIYVSGNTSTTSPGGTTTEHVNSLCFTQGTSCNYEASLWATYVLGLKGYDISSYMPYLITMRDETENQQYLPSSFLFYLTGDFRGELLSIPLPVSNDKYYDTALAFLNFQSETLEEKTNAINWLLDIAQGTDGCWNGGNIRDTAFILYSLWPRTLGIAGGGDEGIDCENAGYFCVSPMTCSEAGGNELGEYDCFSVLDICCNKQILESCEEKGGEICGSDETCSISVTEASDTPECCLGSCRASSEKTECELYGEGNCRTSCYSDEEESDYDCSSDKICCVEKTIVEKKSYWWVWVLLILIVLVVLGIIFKDKLRPLWFKFKTKVLNKIGKGKSKAGPASGPRGFPPSRPGMPPQRPMQRKILPPSQRQPIKPSAKPKGDIDEVLKKLKEMGK